MLCVAIKPLEVIHFILIAGCGILDIDDINEVNAMKARLIKNNNDEVVLLLSNGLFIKSPSVSELGILLFNFKSLDEFGLEKRAEAWEKEYPDLAAIPGQNLAYITDSLQLVVEDISPFLAVFEQVKATVPIESVLTASEYAEKHNKSVEQIKVFCRNGRIWGATKIGRDWVIPKDAPYPADSRMSIGKYS